MFDNICKFLAETFPTDYATWLLGEPIPLTKLEPQELSLEPLRADSVIFLQAPNLVLHLEFQTKPRENLPFRMADYYLRLYRKFSPKNIHQTIIYLTPSNSEIVYQNQFITPQLTHRFHIIRLWEQPTETFQNSLGLMPLAVLTQTPDAVNTLSQIVQTIETIPNPQTQSNLAAATAILSGLKLKPTIIQQLLRSDLMKESVIYQEI
ncbi:MAG: Rpn family recombination-promoting nuclease/putative transposase, partial [Microcystaceae cyanobacterium]